MDNTNGNKAAGRIIQARYPHIFFGGCAAHATDLYLSAVGGMPGPKKVLEDAHKVVKFVLNHHKSNALLKHYSRKTLKRPVETRFVCAYIGPTVLLLHDTSVYMFISIYKLSDVQLITHTCTYACFCHVFGLYTEQYTSKLMCIYAGLGRSTSCASL